MTLSGTVRLLGPPFVSFIRHIVLSRELFVRGKIDGSVR
ncbi:hypothetical protein PUN28_012059 [Cardiocondyla obscurior]|uniref:Uncharacterized protein n=1 Tax=Cardiocondyla obscurior TaxID=286306 RepID=A0AAW2FB67_9HYME